MVSSLDAPVLPTEKGDVGPATDQALADNDHPPPQPEPTERDLGSDHGPRQARASYSPTWKWLLGIGTVIGASWLLSSLINTPPLPRSVAPQTQAQIPPLIPAIEEKPPIGTDLVLGPAQLRYCLAEEIRVEAARKTMNNYVETNVVRFNAMVADYNSRCGQFRYRGGDLENARTDVERKRQTLEAEGRRRF